MRTVDYGMVQPAIAGKLYRIKTKIKQNNLNNFEMNFGKFPRWRVIMRRQQGETKTQVGSW